VPVTLMEPNAVAGLTNRVLRPFICRAYVCFPETAQSFASTAVCHTGVPLRRAFAPAAYTTASAPMRILIMGGSQGAVALNDTVPRAVQRAIASGIEIDVVHQTGKGKDEAVIALYKQLGLSEKVQVTTFIEDVAGALARADLVIERAGAGSLAELCAVGRPGLLIPYPYASDDHQRHNAESLARDGAALCVLPSEATAEHIGGHIERLGGDFELRCRMAAAAARRGRPQAAAEIARDLLALAVDGQGAAHTSTPPEDASETLDDDGARRSAQPMEVYS
jgi:UDP-N-acetylglucosamine--N-acetylmuramyl-(pentapeptide) pyrophosphoryl-undecaprenol N-acetylglucosamine transferase